MSRKDYIKIASILDAEAALAVEPETVARIANITRSIADVFKQDNPRFDRDSFYAAAGLEVLS